MVDSDKISITKTTNSRLEKLDFNNIPFGKVFSDHMFMAECKNGLWDTVQIVPYEDLLINPASPALHYGQSIFEGLKAYKDKEGEILVFRPLDNWKRMNVSAQRMCMPELPRDIFMNGLMELLRLDSNWIPTLPGSSLYIRPLMFAHDRCIGVFPSKEFTFIIITCPVGAYYNKPLKVCVELKYTRAAEGGTGYAKTGGNYSGALYPTKLAQDQGYDQLLWTDGKEHRYIEESGTMNVMFVIDNTLITSRLTDSILPGITRDSVLCIARQWDMKVEERKISIEELINALESGKATEAFGVGTAATIAHIELIGYKGKDYRLPPVSERHFANRMLNTLNDIKTGIVTDQFDWIQKA